MLEGACLPECRHGVTRRWSGSARLTATDLEPLSAHGEPVGHEHTHSHRHAPDEAAADLPPAVDLSVPDDELPPGEMSRRTLLRGAGLLGAGAAATTVLSGAIAADAKPAPA